MPPTSPSTRTPLLRAIEQPASRADRVFDALRRAILAGELPPGTPLVERELAEQLGVSKTPVREALKQLQATRLVEVNAYQGVSVRSFDDTTVTELYEARSAVEPVAVRLAVVNRGAAPHEGARAALADADAHLASGDKIALGEANRRFHRELFAACANPFVVAFLDQLQDLTTFIAVSGWRLNATFEAEAAEHAGILAAFESGDAEAAESLSRAHLRAAEQTLMALVDESPQASPATLDTQTSTGTS